MPTSSVTPLPHAALFLPGPPPPARPNTDPRANIAPASASNLPRVVSPLRREAWARFLADYPDPVYVSSLLHIIDHSCTIGFSGEEATQNCSNLPSAFAARDFVSAAIHKLVFNGYAHGPFEVPPMPSFRSSPLGSVTRKLSSKRRLINHLSWPRGRSVNSGIADSEAAICYDRFHLAVADLRRSGRGTLMAKLDLKEAFHHVPIAPRDWHYMGFSWESQLWYAIVLIFGLRSAPYIFNLFAEGLHWIIQRHVPAAIRHYLDDFLSLFPPDTSLHTASAAVEWIEGLSQPAMDPFQLLFRGTKGVENAS